MVEAEITKTGRTLRINGKFRGTTSDGYIFKKGYCVKDEATILIIDESAQGLGIVASMCYADSLDKEN